MALLLDTNVLVWISTDDARLSPAARRAMVDGQSENYISSVTAWEFVELNARGRFGADLNFAEIVDRLVASILPLPQEIWRLSAALPDLHRDPVDRMLVAHAIYVDMTLLTSDAIMRAYPVKSLWD